MQKGSLKSAHNSSYWTSKEKQMLVYKMLKGFKWNTSKNKTLLTYNYLTIQVTNNFPVSSSIPIPRVMSFTNW